MVMGFFAKSKNRTVFIKGNREMSTISQPSTMGWRLYAVFIKVLGQLLCCGQDIKKREIIHLPSKKSKASIIIS
ncbi:hypothetical protein EAE96_002787 [Botrytis aclada]|nr:hypothetical protein EAE96_002787 [Botrytis aclada]